MFDKILKLFSSEKGCCSKNTILVVEDNEVDRKIIVNIVSKLNVNVIEAENGEVGLQKTKSEKPDLILLDCEMPVMDGAEMCGLLKKDETTKNIPVIFLTSINTPKNIVDCFVLDAENFLSKPINPKILTNQINSILTEKHSKK